MCESACVGKLPACALAIRRACAKACAKACVLGNYLLALAVPLSLTSAPLGFSGMAPGTDTAR